MRCHYVSDLHLEAQAFDIALPKGDMLIIAGDLCHACCFDPIRTDKYSVAQRQRVRRFIDMALANFTHVLLIAGNHDHYDGVFEDTAGLLQRHLPGVTVLDNETVELGGVRFFGSTFWSDFNGRSEVCMNSVRRRIGEFFFVKTNRTASHPPVRFQPEDALLAHDVAWSALGNALRVERDKPLVVITHHAPSLQGLNPLFIGNGLDGAYASDLDAHIAAFDNVPAWIHGHTHIAKTYRIGRTIVRSNALGFVGRGYRTPGFSVTASFEI